jgi:hypothetical protein
MKGVLKILYFDFLILLNLAKFTYGTITKRATSQSWKKKLSDLV